LQTGSTPSRGTASTLRAAETDGSGLGTAARPASRIVRTNRGYVLGMRALVALLLGIAVLAAGGSHAAQPEGLIIFDRLVGEQAVLFSIRPDGSGLRRLSRDRSSDTEPAWAPDGRRFVATTAGGLAIRAPDGRVVRRLRVKRALFDPTWSPDGSRIAYLTESCVDPTGKLDSSCADLWVTRTDGTGRHRLVDAGVSTVDTNAFYSWSPDGRSIVYVGEKGLVIVDVRTGATRFLRRTKDVLAGDPGWSPDGRWIAFTRQRAPFQGSDLFALAPDGGRLHRLSRGFDVLRSSWSPDGRRIAYLVDTPSGDEWNIVVANADGSRPHRIAAATDYGKLVWSPDSSRLVWANFGTLVVARADGRGSLVRLGDGENPDWR
jgi:Tol biopolymer transport system component